MNFALVVAVLSVATTLTAVGVPLLQSRGSNIKVLFERSTQSELIFLVRNDGRTSGVILPRRLRINTPNSQFNDGLNATSELVQPGKEDRIVLAAPEKTIYLSGFLAKWIKASAIFKDGGQKNEMSRRFSESNNELFCTFDFEETSFYKPKIIVELPVNCFALFWVNDMFWATFGAVYFDVYKQ
jgi:hypothetical protein